jgi:hypothetical protein
MNDSSTSNATTSGGDLETAKKEVWQPTIRSFKNILVERWREYVLEIIVVIIGITISFTIANYQTNASNRSLEQTHLIGLLADIESDIDALSAVTEKTRMVVDAAQKLIDEIRRTSPTMTKKEFVSLILSTAERPNYVSKNTTFASLKSSGNFNLITDNELKLLLFAYDAQYQV